MEDRLTVREEKDLEATVRLIETIASPLSRVPKMLPHFMWRIMHRTIQQNFTRLCVAWLVYLSKLDERHYDPRNADSVELAKKFAERIPEEERYLSYI